MLTPFEYNSELGAASFNKQVVHQPQMMATFGNVAAILTDW